LIKHYLVPNDVKIQTANSLDQKLIVCDSDISSVMTGFCLVPGTGTKVVVSMSALTKDSTTRYYY